MESIYSPPAKKFSAKPNILGKADLHIHSKFSPDAFSSIKGILEMADKRNLDLVAITDHDTIKGAERAEKVASGFKVKIIKGEEIGTKDGHLIALFIDNFISPKRPILDTIREIHNQGGLAVVPHPLNRFSRGVSLKTLFKIYKEVDGIELFNASWSAWVSQERIKKLNSKIFHSAAIGGSDAHVLSHVGMGYTIFKGKEPSDLYFSIKNKLTQADGSFNLWSYFALGINQPRRIIKKIWWEIKNGKIRNSWT